MRRSISDHCVLLERAEHLLHSSLPELIGDRTSENGRRELTIAGTVAAARHRFGFNRLSALCSGPMPSGRFPKGFTNLDDLGGTLDTSTGVVGRAVRYFCGSRLATRTLLRCGFVATLLGSTACAMTPERLPDLDRRFYYVLPTPADQKGFLSEPEETRKTYLEHKGLWQQWLGLSEEERTAAAQSTIEVGYHEFTVFMAWGPPADTQDRDRDGREATIHTFIRCSSGPKRAQYVRSNLDCDGTSDETQVAIQNTIVVEIKHPN